MEKQISELRRLGSNLSYSEIADREKEFLKEVCFVLRTGRLCTVLVMYGARLTGIERKRYSGCSFLNIF